MDRRLKQHHERLIEILRDDYLYFQKTLGPDLLEDFNHFAYYVHPERFQLDFPCPVTRQEYIDCLAAEMTVRRKRKAATLASLDQAMSELLAPPSN